MQQTQAAIAIPAESPYGIDGRQRHYPGVPGEVLFLREPTESDVIIKHIDPERLANMKIMQRWAETPHPVQPMIEEGKWSQFFEQFYNDMF